VGCIRRCPPFGKAIAMALFLSATDPRLYFLLSSFFLHLALSAKVAWYDALSVKSDIWPGFFYAGISPPSAAVPFTIAGNRTRCKFLNFYSHNFSKFIIYAGCSAECNADSDSCNAFAIWQSKCYKGSPELAKTLIPAQTSDFNVFIKEGKSIKSTIIVKN
jgi:hypothetical protein